MSIIGKVIDNIKFNDTVFLKEDSELKRKCEALKKLNQEYPNNNAIQEELFIAEKGLDGEKEIKKQLDKSNIGMYVLHDIKLQYKDLKAQIDYVVVTRFALYFLECKNLVGNITVDEKGAFIREYQIGNRIIKKGMYSPLRQVEAQRDVYKKIWLESKDEPTWVRGIRKITTDHFFKESHRVLVVVANHETILDTKNAPQEIKSKVLRADELVRQIQYDLEHSNKQDWGTKRETENWARNILSNNVELDIDYYKYYKLLFQLDKKTDEGTQNQLLKDRLIQFRKKRAEEMNIPAYYVYNNEELEMLIKMKPKTLEKLIEYNILPSIKVKTHGEKIIEEIKNCIGQ